MTNSDAKVPEPSPAKGPSEVTQPGEGVEAVLREMEAIPFAVGIVTVKDWANRIRATLRRESK